MGISIKGEHVKIPTPRDSTQKYVLNRNAFTKDTYKNVCSSIIDNSQNPGTIPMPINSRKNQ